MKKTIILIIILVVIILGVYLIISSNKNTNQTNVLPATNSVLDTTNPVSNTTPVSATSEAKVEIKNFSFSPQTIKIKVGDKITWTNNDSVAHTVTSDSDNLLDSPTFSPGESFSFVFTKAGSTNYHCNIHKTMKGTVVVE